MKHIKSSAFIPSKFNFALLFVVWLLLTNSYSVGNLLLAALLSWAIPRFVREIRSNSLGVSNPWKAPKYILVLLWDIMVSNLIVARQVLSSESKLQPGFIAVPLDMTEPLPITLLASSISLTPGTVSTEVSEDHCTLYVHALNIDDEAELIKQIKTRYEAPLKEIFGC